MTFRLHASMVLLPALLLLQITFAAGTNEVPVQADSLCQFILQRYQLSPAKERAFNQIVADLLQRHEEVFGFKTPTNFHLQIRLFGRREDFQQFATTNASPFEANMGGYYSPIEKQVNLWLPEEKSYLAKVVLHECSHAIMDSRFRRLPVWLSEGSADYFSIPRNMQGTAQTWLLKHRWGDLNRWLKDGSLPELKTFLNLEGWDYYSTDLDRAYTASWSLFQFLKSTPEKQKIMNEMLRRIQIIHRPPATCSEVLGTLYPGGLVQFEKDWHEWIRLPLKTPFVPPPLGR